MTIGKAIENGIRFVKREQWNQYAHLELPTDPAGPWAFLIDPASNKAMGEEPLHKLPLLLLAVKDKVGPFCIDPDEDIWDEWVKPADYDEPGRWQTGLL